MKEQIISVSQEHKQYHQDNCHCNQNERIRASPNSYIYLCVCWKTGADMSSGHGGVQ